MIVLILSPLTKAQLNFLKVINEFQENVAVKTGDVLQCEITKTDLKETEKYYIASTGGTAYTYYPVSEKCFSFRVRTLKEPHIALSNTHDIIPGTVEIVLEIGSALSYIRERDQTLGFKILSRKNISGLVNDKEYRGFWIRWLDDELVEIGRQSETTPFLYHKFPRKLQINYFAVLSWTVQGVWIIDAVPKCPGTEVQKKMKTESECMILN